MNWKEFLRPSKVKITIALVLFLILPLIPIPTGCTREIDDADPCPTVFMNGAIFFMALFSAFPIMLSGMQPSQSFIIMISLAAIFSILAFVIYYLITCVLAHTYKTKVKK